MLGDEGDEGCVAPFAPCVLLKWEDNLIGSFGLKSTLDNLFKLIKGRLHICPRTISGLRHVLAYWTTMRRVLSSFLTLAFDDLLCVNQCAIIVQQWWHAFLNGNFPIVFRYRYQQSAVDPGQPGTAFQNDSHPGFSMRKVRRDTSRCFMVHNTNGSISGLKGSCNSKCQ